LVVAFQPTDGDFMPYLSYLFTVQPGRQHAYRFGGSFEVKTIVADDLEVWVTDQNGVIRVKVFDYDILLGTSIIVGPNHYLEFINQGGILVHQSKEGYFGVAT
jgi:hypothetical protein